MKQTYIETGDAFYIVWTTSQIKAINTLNKWRDVR